MTWTNPAAPNLTDFITFCQSQGVVAAVLNPDSPDFQWALDYAVDRAPYVPPVPVSAYILACYNLGLHVLIESAQDQTGLAITSMAWAGGLVTVTAPAALGFNVGETFPVMIVGTAPVGYNGCYTACVTGADTFTYPLETNPGAVTAIGLFNMSFFATARSLFKLLQLVAGPVQSTGDQGTNTTLVVPDFFKTLTLEDLDLIKTPWGRRYLAYAQKAGPTVVGIS
jgi:hypothetical protein